MGRLFAALLLALSFGIAVSTSPSMAQTTAAAAYKLGAGDKVHVTVFNEPDLTGDFTVSDQGSIALPLIGNVTVGGMTVRDAEVLVTQKYGTNYLVNPRVSIEVLNYRPFFILGEVKTPGSYPYVSGMTVLNAVALAGGYTPRAKQGSVSVKRTGGPQTTEQTLSEDSAVLPGDVITVKERFF
jgi:polysaccharide export outer membrane protein